MCSHNGIKGIAQVLELLTFTLNCVVFEEIYVKKAGGGGTPPGKLQLSSRFGFFSYWVCPSIWPSFTEIGEMACITSAWSSGERVLKSLNEQALMYLQNLFTYIHTYIHAYFIA